MEDALQPSGSQKSGKPAFHDTAPTDSVHLAQLEGQNDVDRSFALPNTTIARFDHLWTLLLLQKGFNGHSAAAWRCPRFYILSYPDVSLWRMEDDN